MSNKKVSGFCLTNHGNLLSIDCYAYGEGDASFRHDGDIFDYGDDAEENIEFLGGKIYTKLEKLEDKIILSEPVNLYEFCGVVE